MDTISQTQSTTAMSTCGKIEHDKVREHSVQQVAALVRLLAGCARCPYRMTCAMILCAVYLCGLIAALLNNNPLPGR